jgi:tetratricopeptide (TPR) repeat protein
MKKSIVTAFLFALSLAPLERLVGQELISQAEVQLSKGNYSEALLLLNNQISKNPKDQKAYLKLASIQSKLGKVDLACATYGAIESMGLVSDEFHFEYGVALKLIGKYDEAIAKFKLCSKDYKNSASKQIESCVYARNLINTEDSKKVMNMDINSEYDEVGPAIYGNNFVFSSVKKPFMTELTASQLADFSGIYASKSLMNGSASAILMEGKAFLNNMEAISITDNNKIVYSVSTSNSPEINQRAANSKLFLGSFNGHAIENIQEFTLNDKNASIYSGCLNLEGDKLIFASNMEGGYGGFDLYSSTLENGVWTTPLNLGSEINTNANELTPNYNNGILWYASNGLDGLGGFDLFTSFLSDDKFSTPINMGVGINSSMDDLYPCIKNLVIYFSSSRNGNYDIFRSPLSESHYTINFNAKVSEQVLASVEGLTELEENIPAAVEIGNVKSGKSISELLSNSRRVSLSEVITKEKPIVYFIQLAAVANNGTTKTDKFKQLLKYGNIYKVAVNNASKIRLGYFLGRDETDKLLSKVKGAGFKDAFIVSQELNNDAMEIIAAQNEYSSVEANKSTTIINTPKPVVTKNNTTTTSTPVVKTRVESNSDRQYKVRVGAFEDPIWFDSKKVNDLGKLEQWTKGAWTIFILSGFSDFNGAEQARIQAINRGYTDAEVVIDNGGIIERIKKN